MPVRLAVAIIGVMSLVGARSGGTGIAYLTHLGGIAVALLYVKYYGPFIAWLEERRLPAQQKKPSVLQFSPKKENAGKRQYFEEVIDPILKKISEKEYDSLTPEEREADERFEEAPEKMRFLLFLCFSLSSALAGDLRFWKETIALEVMSPDTLVIKGTYLFTSKSGDAGRYALYYPFPLDSAMDYPSSITVTSEEDKRCSPLSGKRKGSTLRCKSRRPALARPRSSISSMSVVAKGNTFS